MAATPKGGDDRLPDGAGSAGDEDAARMAHQGIQLRIAKAAYRRDSLQSSCRFRRGSDIRIIRRR
jgi:hypothetical protein